MDAFIVLERRPTSNMIAPLEFKPPRAHPRFLQKPNFFAIFLLFLKSKQEKRKRKTVSKSKKFDGRPKITKKPRNVRI